jgi:DNA-directed RNA polymerase subunit RPC12/RpoP
MKPPGRLLQAKVNMKADQHKLCCIRCGRPMRFARSILRPAELPKLDTFECGYCGLAITAEGAAEVLNMAVQFMPFNRRA